MYAIYKITVRDESGSPTFDDAAIFFTDDLNAFEENWGFRVCGAQLKRYLRSKAGEMITDVYSKSKRFNIVQEDKDAIILFEKSFLFVNHLFLLERVDCWKEEVFAREASLVFCGIRFAGEYFLVGSYRLEGVCKKEYSFTNESYAQCIPQGNPITNNKIHAKTNVIMTERGVERFFYQKEDFREDSIETYCFVTVGKFSKEELLGLQLQLKSKVIINSLLRDLF